MLTSIRSLALLCIAAASPVLVCNTAFAASHYDALRDFRLRSNPAGVWSYMDAALLTHKHHSYERTADLENWSNGQDDRNAGYIIRNITGSPVTVDGGTTTIPTDVLALDAEVDRPGVALRFTAPTAGSYTFKCKIQGLNTDEAKYTELFVNYNVNQQLENIYVHSHTRKRLELTLAMAAGDTLDFLNRGNPRPKPDYIGLDVKVSGP